MPETEDRPLEELTKDELQEILAELDLPTSGNKAELVERIKEETEEVPEESKPDVALIDTLLGLRDEIENQLDGRYPDRVQVALNNISSALGQLSDSLWTERALVQP